MHTSMMDWFGIYWIYWHGIEAINYCCNVIIRLLIGFQPYFELLYPLLFFT